MSDDAEHLTTGWEDEVPADDSLLRAFVLTTVERSEWIASAVDGRVERTGALSLVDAGSPIWYDNLCTFLRPLSADEAQSAVADALAFFPPERAFVVVSAWPIPHAGDLGIELMGHPPFMFRPAGPPPSGRRGEGLDVRRVTDADELAVFFRTMVEAYPMEGGDSPLADPAVLSDDLRFWVGYEDGRPVGTAGTYVAHGTNDVEWISVYDEHRGKGYGEELTWVATLAEPDLPAVLIASDPGQPVYEKMGYVRLTRLSLWFRPPGAG
jgi:GNAT superfamily N-acetyltransferase